MMLDNAGIPKKIENLLERDLEDEVLVISPEGKVLHTFQGSARFIWTMIDGVRTIGDIMEGLTGEYQVETAAARSDLEAFIEELRKLCLIHIQ